MALLWDADRRRCLNAVVFIGNCYRDALIGGTTQSSDNMDTILRYCGITGGVRELDSTPGNEWRYQRPGWSNRAGESNGYWSQSPVQAHAVKVS